MHLHKLLLFISVDVLTSQREAQNMAVPLSPLLFASIIEHLAETVRASEQVKAFEHKPDHIRIHYMQTTCFYLWMVDSNLCWVLDHTIWKDAVYGFLWTFVVHWLIMDLNTLFNYITFSTQSHQNQIRPSVSLSDQIEIIKINVFCACCIQYKCYQSVFSLSYLALQLTDLFGKISVP